MSTVPASPHNLRTTTPSGPLLHDVRPHLDARKTTQLEFERSQLDVRKSSPNTLSVDFDGVFKSLSDGAADTNNFTHQRSSGDFISRRKRGSNEPMSQQSSVNESASLRERAGGSVPGGNAVGGRNLQHSLQLVAGSQRIGDETPESKDSYELDELNFPDEHEFALPLDTWPAILMSEAEKSMDDVLKDDNRCGKFLKELISLNDLRKVWEALKTRMRSAETQISLIQSTLNRQTLERDFVLLEEYRLTVEGAHGHALDDHANRLSKLEVDAEQRQKQLQGHREELSGLHAWKETVESTLENHLDEMSNLKKQDIDHHNNVLDIISVLQEENKVLEEKIEEEKVTSDMREKAGEEMRGFFDKRVEKIETLLSGENFIRHIRMSCTDLLKDYIPWADMDAEVCKTAQDLLKPFHDHIAGVQNNLDATRESLLGKHAEHRFEFNEVQSRLQMCTTDLKRLWDELTKYSRMDKVLEIEDSLYARTKLLEEVADEVGVATTSKLEEISKRVNLLQQIMDDHEHVLQHQSEELLNRATKYDMVVNTHKIDLCAAKATVDESLKSIKNTLKWQSEKIEELVFSSNFVGGMDDTRSSRFGSFQIDHGSLENSVEDDDSISAQSSRNTSRGTTRVFPPRLLPDSANVDSRDGIAITARGAKSPSSHTGPIAMTETIMLRSQLTALAEVVLLIGHLLFKSKAVPRDTRVERENDAIHHADSIIYWLRNRKCPAGWEPGRLQTAALALAEKSGASGKANRTTQELWGRLQDLKAVRSGAMTPRAEIPLPSVPGSGAETPLTDRPRTHSVTEQSINELLVSQVPSARILMPNPSKSQLQSDSETVTVADDRSASNSVIEYSATDDADAKQQDKSVAPPRPSQTLAPLVPRASSTERGRHSEGATHNQNRKFLGHEDAVAAGKHAKRASGVVLTAYAQIRLKQNLKSKTKELGSDETQPLELVSSKAASRRDCPGTQHNSVNRDSVNEELPPVNRSSSTSERKSAT